MRVAIIDYGSGNLRSAVNAFERAAGEAGVDAEIELTDRADRVAGADRIVLPGVGAYADCRRGLNAVPGMVEALEETVRGKGRPFLGICVGMQLMAARGREFGVTPGLDWIAGEVRLLEPGADHHGRQLKVPHMGWNELQLSRSHPVFDGLVTGSHFYFVHSYHLAVEDPADLLATCDYGGPVTAAVARANMVGTQFHPEKSQALGLKLLANFLAWKP
jgi:glutamine amidotransferase